MERELKKKIKRQANFKENDLTKSKVFIEALDKLIKAEPLKEEKPNKEKNS